METVVHRGTGRQVSKRSSGTLQTLPDSCCARALSYLELREVSLVEQCSLMSQVRALAPELWLMFCEARWPAVGSHRHMRTVPCERNTQARLYSGAN